MPEAVSIELLSYVPLRNRTCLQSFLEFLETESGFAPTEWGSDERRRDPYDAGARNAIIEEVCAYKGQFLTPTLRRRKAFKYEASFECYPDGLGRVSFDFDPGPANADLPRLFEFADALMLHFKPALGFIHRFWRIGADSQTYDASASSGSDDLQKYGLHPPCTRTWYGPQLTEMIGLPLLNASGALVEEMSWGGVRLDLVRQPWDVEPALLAAAQAPVMQTLWSSGAYGDFANFLSKKPGARWTPLADSHPVLPKARWPQPPPVPESYTVGEAGGTSPEPDVMPSAIKKQYPAVAVQLMDSIASRETLTMVDISGLDLSRIDLTELDTERLLANRTLLRDALLTEARLFEAVMEDAVLTRAHLAGARLDMAHLTRVDLHDVILRRCSFTLGKCDHCDLTEADLSESDLTETFFSDCDLTDAVLRKVRADGTFFGRARLVNADLGGGSFVASVFHDADLSGADLTGADLSQADCRGADFRGATLTDVDWTGTQLLDARFDAGSIPLRPPE